MVVVLTPNIDVVSSQSRVVCGSKGYVVFPLKRYLSKVQNVVRQFGPYLVVMYLVKHLCRKKVQLLST